MLHRYAATRKGQVSGILNFGYTSLVLTDICTAIPFNQGTHLKYFEKGKEVYNEYYGLLLRCSSIFDPTQLNNTFLDGGVASRI